MTEQKVMSRVRSTQLRFTQAEVRLISALLCRNRRCPHDMLGFRNGGWDTAWRSLTQKFDSIDRRWPESRVPVTHAPHVSRAAVRG
jgi:hypothetical protein